MNWPAEKVRDKLLALNREFLKDSPNPLLKGRNNWPNQQLERFAEELAEARAAGIVIVSPDDPGFVPFLNSTSRFNWAILLDGSLRVSASIVATSSGIVRISHAVLCPGGGDVLAAGEGRAGDYLSNTTGHYKNEEFVIEPVREAFATIGITFKA